MNWLSDPTWVEAKVNLPTLVSDSDDLIRPTILLSNLSIDLELQAGDIHIWCASLDQSESRIQILSQTLSTDERTRAERFCFEKDRKRFVICRGILRKILGNYMSVDPDKLMFCYGKYGKPAIVDTYDNGKICFNLAHSEGLAVYAFNIGSEIGVDIEYIRDISEMNQIADYLFSETEKEVFRTLPEIRKKETFFKCWTRKEAIIKATGEGLYQHLNKFDVITCPDEPIKVIKIDRDFEETSHWTIYDLKLFPDHVSALAIKGINNWRFRYRQWSG